MANRIVLGYVKGEKGDKGDQGKQGVPGKSPSISFGTVTTLPAGSNAEVQQRGTSDAIIFDLSIPRGDKGEKGDKGDQGIQGEKGDKGDQGIQGNQGIQGETGLTPNIGIGTVSTGATGSDASATITGTPEAPRLNLTIPRGEKGEKGDTGTAGQNGQDGADGKDGVGITSITKTSTSGLVDTYTINLSNGRTSTFTVTNGKDGSTSSSNPNLLINSNFAINQRGQTSYTPSSIEYTVDRWRTAGTSFGNFIITPSSNGIVLASTATTSRHLIQVIEKTLTTSEKYALSASVDGVIKSLTFVNDKSAQTLKFDGCDIQYLNVSGSDRIYIYVQAAATVNVNWVKLEYGDTATEYTPPDPATELLKCQRYYIKSEATMYACAYATGGYRWNVIYPLPMRTTPTITKSGISVDFISDKTQYGFVFGINSPGTPCRLDSFTADAEIY